MSDANFIPDMAGVILAGGASSRFGSNKALAELSGRPVISHTADILNKLFQERLLITNTPHIYEFLNWNTTPDLYPGEGPLAGIHSALATIKAKRAFIAGCDMPFLNQKLIRHLCQAVIGCDAAIPRHCRGIEPLYAAYDKNILAELERSLRSGDRKVSLFLERIRVRWVDEQEILGLGMDLTTFYNINRPADLAACSGMEPSGIPS